MISLKLRIIREKNRVYMAILKLCSVLAPTAPKIFLFHDILETRSQVKSEFAISQASFETFLLNQMKKGNKPLTFNQLSDAVLNKSKIRNGFYVSFDDANESVYTHAYPFLKEHQIPFIVFLTRELINKPNFLNEQQIKLLSSDSLCTIGSHGLRHKMFRYFSDEEVATEYGESKKYLQDLTGQNVDCFAFPYGRVVECSGKNVRLLKQSDYNFAFSAIAGNLGEKCLSGTYFLPRINVSEKMVEKL